MAENSNIEWTDHTFNPWYGCTKVGPGCDHCYAEARMDTRLHRVQWGAGQPRVRTKDWGDPGRWNRQHEAFFAAHGRRQRVFCASLADVFDNEVPAQWRVDLFRLIADTPNLDWLLLTKRIGNVSRMLRNVIDSLVRESASTEDEPPYWPWPNVWIGATIVNQEEADRDIPKLLEVPARVRFLSMEPLLGPVEFSNVTRRADAVRQLGKKALAGIDWVIVGGESGHGARPMHPDWARSLRDQCAAAGVPFLFKQHGEWVSPGERAFGTARTRRVALLRPDGSEVDPQSAEGRDENANVITMADVGKKAAGRLLDGQQHDGFPEVR
jgi:protein gp37